MPYAIPSSHSSSHILSSLLQSLTPGSSPRNSPRMSPRMSPRDRNGESGGYFGLRTSSRAAASAGGDVGPRVNVDDGSESPSSVASSSVEDVRDEKVDMGGVEVVNADVDGEGGGVGGYDVLLPILPDELLVDEKDGGIGRRGRVVSATSASGVKEKENGYLRVLMKSLSRSRSRSRSRSASRERERENAAGADTSRTVSPTPTIRPSPNHTNGSKRDASPVTAVLSQIPAQIQAPQHKPKPFKSRSLSRLERYFVGLTVSTATSALGNNATTSSDVSVSVGLGLVEEREERVEGVAGERAMGEDERGRSTDRRPLTVSAGLGMNEEQELNTSTSTSASSGTPLEDEEILARGREMEGVEDGNAVIAAASAKLWTISGNDYEESPVLAASPPAVEPEPETRIFPVPSDVLANERMEVQTSSIPTVERIVGSSATDADSDNSSFASTSTPTSSLLVSSSSSSLSSSTSTATITSSILYESPQAIPTLSGTPTMISSFDSNSNSSTPSGSPNPGLTGRRRSNTRRRRSWQVIEGDDRDEEVSAGVQPDGANVNANAVMDTGATSTIAFPSVEELDAGVAALVESSHSLSSSPSSSHAREPSSPTDISLTSLKRTRSNASSLRLNLDALQNANTVKLALGAAAESSRLASSSSAGSISTIASSDSGATIVQAALASLSSLNGSSGRGHTVSLPTTTTTETIEGATGGFVPPIIRKKSGEIVKSSLKKSRSSSHSAAFGDSRSSLASLSMSTSGSESIVGLTTPSLSAPNTPSATIGLGEHEGGYDFRSEMDIGRREVRLSTSSSMSSATSKFVHFSQELEDVRVFVARQKPANVGRASVEDSATEGETSGTEVEDKGLRGLRATVNGTKTASDDEEMVRRGLVLKILNVPRLMGEPALSSLLPLRGNSQAEEEEDPDVHLETLGLSQDSRAVLGNVRVKNLAFEKWVAVRFTLDGWQTTSEVSARWLEATDGPSISSFGRSETLRKYSTSTSSEPTAIKDTITYDRFTFTIRLTDLLARIKGKTLMLAVRYQTMGKEMWDNNLGDNYKAIFEVVPPAPSPVKVPLAVEGLPSVNSTESDSDVGVSSPIEVSGLPVIGVAGVSGLGPVDAPEKVKDSRITEHDTERTNAKSLKGIKKPEQRDPLASRYDFAASFKEKSAWNPSLEWNADNSNRTANSSNVQNLNLKTQQLAKINLNKWRSSVPWPEKQYGQSAYGSNGHFPSSVHPYTQAHMSGHSRSQSHTGHQTAGYPRPPHAHHSYAYHSQATSSGSNSSVSFPSTTNQLIGTKNTRVEFVYDPHERRIRGSPRDMYLDEGNSGRFTPPVGSHRQANSGVYDYGYSRANPTDDRGTASPFYENGQYQTKSYVSGGGVNGRLKQRSYFDAWAIKNSMQRETEKSGKVTRCAHEGHKADADRENRLPSASVPLAYGFRATHRSFSDADAEALTPNGMSPPLSGLSSRTGTPLAENAPLSPVAPSRHHSFPPLGSPVLPSSGGQQPQYSSPLQLNPSVDDVKRISSADGGRTSAGPGVLNRPQAQSIPDLYVDVATPVVTSLGDAVSEVSTPALTTSIFSSPTVSPTMSSISSPQMSGIGLMSPMFQNGVNVTSPLNILEELGSPYANSTPYSLVLDKFCFYTGQSHLLKVPAHNNDYTPTRMRRSLSASTIEQYLASPLQSNDGLVANGTASSMFDDVIMPSRMSEPSITSYLKPESPMATTPMVS